MVNEGKSIVNEKWVAENRQRSQEWCKANHHLMGNSKGDISGPEVFYTLSDTSLTLALRYPSTTAKGNVGRAITFNLAYLEFKAELEKELMELLILKHEFLAKSVVIK